MTGVDTLVSETSVNFKDFFAQTADHKSFQIKFGSYSHEHIHIKGVVVSDKRSCVCAACLRVKHWGFDFQKAA